MAKKAKKSKLQKKREDPNSRLWRNKADHEWAIYIHRTGVCAICGATEHLQAHHLIPREIKHLRHCPDNGILLCIKHHKYYYQLSAHKNSLAFSIWLQEHLPEKWEWVVGAMKIKPSEPNYKEAYEALRRLNQEHQNGQEVLLRSRESGNRDQAGTTEEAQSEPEHAADDQATCIIKAGAESGSAPEGNAAIDITASTRK